MKKLTLILLSSLCLAISSCGRLSDKNALELLNNSEIIPAIYQILQTPEEGRGWWIGNTNEFNSGGNWAKITTPQDYERVHKIDVPPLHEIEPNATMINQDGKPVYVLAMRGGLYRGCKGCMYCYKLFSDMGLIEDNILKGEIDTEENLLVNITLTEKGEEYRLSGGIADKLLSNESQSFIQVAEYVFTKITSLTQDGSNATANVEYRIEYTPFGKALGCEDTPCATTKCSFVKFDDIGWVATNFSSIN